MLLFKRSRKIDELKAINEICALDAWAMDEELNGNFLKAYKIKKIAQRMFWLQIGILTMIY